MGDENPIRTLGDYSKPSHEGYQNTIELPEGNNVVPLRSDTIRLVQNGYSFHELWSEDPNQHLKDFLKLVDSLDLNVENKNAWATIKELARYEDEGWNDPVVPEKESLNYENLNLEQLLGIMKYKVRTLMEEAITLMGRSESIFRISSNLMHQLPPEPSSQEAFEDLVMNFILNQEERVKQLEEYMGVIGSDFMQLSLDVVEKLKEEIRIKKNKFTKIKKITRYPDTEDLEPLNGDKFSEALTEKASFYTPKFVSPKSLCVKHIRTIFPSPPLIRESTFGFKPGAKNNQNVKPRHDAKNASPQSTPQVFPSFEEYTPPVTYPEEVEETIRIPMEVEPLDHTKLEDFGLNTCSHDLFFSSREILSVDELEP
ncbi:hypothetical protein Tco_1467635 [Tanacetum coccineum]